MTNQCIRIFADANQIEACKKSLQTSSDSIEHMSKVFNLAGNKIRMNILYLLWVEKRLCVCDLSDIIGISIPGVSQHLRKMKDGGIVQSEREGQTIYYSLVEQFKFAFETFFVRAENNVVLEEQP